MRWFVLNFEGQVDDPAWTLLYSGKVGREGREAGSRFPEKQAFHSQKAAPPGQRNSTNLTLHETV